MGDGSAFRVLGGFAVFGVCWGAWGAAMPAVQDRAGVGEGAFGAALLLIGVGALGSMRLTGVLLDRFGRRVARIVVLAFAVAALGAGSAVSAPTLAVALFALGACSGAFDVIINTSAVRYESLTGKPLLGAAHAAFSAAVVVAAALTGVARSAGAGPPVIFAVVAALLCVAAAFGRIEAGGGGRREAGGGGRIEAGGGGKRAAGGGGKRETRETPAGGRRRVSGRVLLFGGLCALANLVENAQQSWSARQLEVVLEAPPHISGLGPSVFALATVNARLAAQALAHRRVPARAMLRGGAVLAALGTAVMAFAPDAWLCLAGIAVAGLGTGVCAPTIISAAGAGVPAERRGAAISMVMTIAYAGFAAGPAFVGLIADRAGLRGALGAVAVVAVILAAAVTFLPRAAPTDGSGYGSAPRRRWSPVSSRRRSEDTKATDSRRAD